MNQFSTAHNGIPINADIEKRQIGQQILSKFPDEFVSFLYLMPNGTVYLLEPYARQQNLSSSDLSHRDYYKGMIKTYLKWREVSNLELPLSYSDIALTPFITNQYRVP